MELPKLKYRKIGMLQVLSLALLFPAFSFGETAFESAGKLFVPKAGNSAAAEPAVPLTSEDENGPNYTWDAIIVKQIAKQPETKVQCGEKSYVIGGNTISGRNLLLGMKSSLIKCRRTGPWGMACGFLAEETSASEGRTPGRYSVEFTIRKGPRGVGPTVEFDRKITCRSLGH